MSNRNLFLLIVIIAAASLRLFGLDTLEPFIDEGLHLNWSMSGQFLIDLKHGFKVLGYIIFYPTATWADNALWATRLLVAVLGVGSAIGVFMAANALAGPPGRFSRGSSLGRDAVRCFARQDRLARPYRLFFPGLVHLFYDLCASEQFRPNGFFGGARAWPGVDNKNHIPYWPVLGGAFIFGVFSEKTRFSPSGICVHSWFSHSLLFPFAQIHRRIRIVSLLSRGFHGSVKGGV